MPAISEPWGRRLLWLMIGLLAFSYSKGMFYDLNPWGRPYAYLNYTEGFVKRGLVGQGMHWLMAGQTPARYDQAFITLHLLLGALLIGLVIAIFRLAETGAREWGNVCLWAVLALCAGSMFWPTLAIDGGFLDVHLYVIFALGLLACMRQRYLLAAAMALVSPLVHESGIFVWMPLFTLLAWEMLRARRIEPRACLPMLAAALGTGFVFFMHSQPAAESLLRAAPLTDEVKQGMLDVQMGQTLLWAHGNMLRMWQAFTANGVFSLFYFGWPALAMLGLYTAMRRLRALDAAALAVASLLPLSILLVAWDLSRFIVYVNFATLLVLCYWEYRHRPEARRPKLALLAVPLTLATLFSPMLYAYFDIVFVHDMGLFPFNRTFYGEWMTELFPKELRHIGES